MKKSISYWAFPGGLSGEAPIVESMRSAKSAGFDAIELAVGQSGQLTFDLSDDRITAFRRAAEQVGIEISSLASLATFDILLTSNDPAKREQSRACVARMLEIAPLLGTDAILVVPGAVDVCFNPETEIIDYEVAYERLLEAARSLAPVAQRNRVHLCLENVWNKFLLSPLEMRDLIDKIGSDYVGAYFDVGNVVLTGYPEQWIRILGTRIRRVHLKDFRRSVGTINGFVDLLEGDVNWLAVMSALRAINYDSYLTAEIIPPYAHFPAATLENTSRSMDHIIAAQTS